MFVLKANGQVRGEFPEKVSALEAAGELLEQGISVKIDIAQERLKLYGYEINGRVYELASPVLNNNGKISGYIVNIYTLLQDKAYLAVSNVFIPAIRTRSGIIVDLPEGAISLRQASSHSYRI
jgi:hypothetical protein